MVLIESVVFMDLLWLIIMIARRSTLTETTDYSESGSAVSTSSVSSALSPTPSSTATTTRPGRHCPVLTVWLLRLQGFRKEIYKLVSCESSEEVTVTRQNIWAVSWALSLSFLCAYVVMFVDCQIKCETTMNVNI